MMARIFGLLMAVSPIATWPVRSPVAFPAGKPAAPELQVEPVLPVRQGAAFDIGQSEQHFAARAAPDINQRRPQHLRNRLRIHAEKQRRIVRHGSGYDLLGRSRRNAGGCHRQDRGHAEKHPSHGGDFHGCNADSLPSGVHPPPSAWNRLLAASSFVNRTCAREFSAVSRVCWVCRTVMRLTVPARNWVSDTSKALCESLTASSWSRSCRVNCASANSAFSTSAKADSTALR